ncbi:hypothetical protein [Leptospira dzoumogneensis]|uniref:hypothetical protein n=1 Tax=Leptospira dzoumogneensis TaxID=2484904 RepID=UPI001FCCB51A|nr:hypothetical protein [Leptospira dzoumogneensis]
MGYGFECEEVKLTHELDRIQDRLDRYLLENHIRKKCFSAKLENSGKIFKGFMGFLSEDISDCPGDLEEVEIETGKYLKFGNLPVSDNITSRLVVDKKVRTFLAENNIRTDWVRFSSGKNSYLRIIN